MLNKMKKKLAFIGLIAIAIIFQNCKNGKTDHEVLTEENTETKIEQEIDTTVGITQDIPSEEATPVSNASEKSNTTIVESNKSTEKKVVNAPVNTPTIPKKEENEVKKLPDEKLVEKAEEIRVVISNEVEESKGPEPVVDKEIETEPATQPITENTTTITSINDWIVPAKYLTMKNPTNPKEDLSIGKSLYDKHCKSCHGKEGYGDGPKADEMKGDLGDFSSAKVQKQSDGALFYKTTIGRDDMPEFTKKLPDDEDRWLIVNYMRTLAE